MQRQLFTVMSKIKQQNNEKIRMSLVFHGYVQGVGFRYTAHHAALSLGLTGWVRNEYDGSVSAEIQGDRDGIEKWIRMIQGGRFIEITDIDRKETVIDPDERSFQVRY